MLPFFRILPVLLALLLIENSAPAEPALSIRGYYTTFMRMPTFGLTEWQRMINAMHEDGTNCLILWTAGAFRSKKFPVTWRYNNDHQNVEHDFLRQLIDYAHERDIRIVLGFTPFAYDGANQYPLDHPELKATQRNGDPVALWGMHSWGHNLCPAWPQSQSFMLDYVREMFFDFYPNADGVMIESSDYAICHCEKCRNKFFDREFEFVRKISDEIWAAKPNATVMVYPHYFNGRTVPGFDVTAAKQSFDQRWTLFFTPHSAHLDPQLLRSSKTSIYWNEGLTLGTPEKIREGARLAKTNHMSGYLPSLEPMSCTDGPSERHNRRHKPFHFEWLNHGDMPLDELLIRVNRRAYREFSHNPDLPDAAFRKVLGREFFGDAATPQATDDVLFLQECWNLETNWFTPGVLVDRDRLKERSIREKWGSERLAGYAKRVDRLREIISRYADGTKPAAREMRRIATLMVVRWDERQ
ncbi:MAG: hypothetical protein ACR2OZ_17790 [Verrucomicrobiales bacterium]